LKNDLPATSGAKVDLQKYLENIRVTVDGEVVKAKYSVNRDQDLTISFDEIEIAAKKNSTFVVSMTLTEDFDDYAKYTRYSLVKESDFNATEKKT
jgi:ribosomal 50S subunit-recycling heat shock protein